MFFLHSKDIKFLVTVRFTVISGTILAYGQTGTGKTFTMMGNNSCPGIIPNSFAHIFDHISKCQQDKTFLVRVSYLEIYNEEIRDLLAKNPVHGLEIKVEMIFLSSVS